MILAKRNNCNCSWQTYVTLRGM